MEESIHKLTKAQGWIKGPDNVLFHIRKLPLTNSKWDHLAKEIITHEHDKTSTVHTKCMYDEECVMY